MHFYIEPGTGSMLFTVLLGIIGRVSVWCECCLSSSDTSSANVMQSTSASLKELIDSCLSESRFAEGRRQVKEETWANYGKGAEKAAEYLLRKQKKFEGK